MQRVFWTSTSTPTRGQRQRSLRRRGWPRRRSLPSRRTLPGFQCPSGRVEELLEQVFGKVLLFVHLTDERADGLAGEVADGGAERLARLHVRLGQG